MPKVKLTKKYIDRLPSISKRVDYYDTECKGLMLRLNVSGDKYYAIRYRNQIGKYMRYTIGKHGAITLIQARKEAHRLLGLLSQGVDIQAQKKIIQSDILFAEYVKFFIDWFYQNRKTGYWVERVLTKDFLCWENYSLKSISADMLYKWVMGQKKGGATNARINRKVVMIKSAFSRAVEFGYLKSTPFVGFKMLKEEKTGVIRYLSDEEKDRLFEALVSTSPLISNIVKIAYYTGMRRGEIFTLEFGDIDFKTNQIMLNKGNTKNGKSRHIPMHKEVLNILSSIFYDNCSGLVFKSPITGRKLDNINKAWATLMTKSNIQNFRFHDLRHNFASQLVMKGESLATVRELLGHSDFKMTLRYAHLAPEHKQKAVDLL